MSLKQTLSEDLKDAMRSKDRARLSAIRMLAAAILDREKSGEGVPSEPDLVAIVQKQAKQRRDSISQFRSAGREDLALQEEAELEVIEQYLPPQLTEEEIRAAVEGIVTHAGASGVQDMGRVMGLAMQELRGKADGNLVRRAVQSILKDRSVQS